MLQNDASCNVYPKIGTAMSLPALNQDEIKFVHEAARFLDNPGFAMRAMNLLGQPIDALQKKLPASVQDKIGGLVQKALQTALVAAIKTVPAKSEKPTNWRDAVESSKKSGRIHTATVAVTGAVGGLFGLLALPVELPLSTTMMLRGISDVAGHWGMDLDDPNVQLQCLYVFTLGSTQSPSDDENDSAYLGSRIAFEQIIRSASTYMAKKSAKEILRAIDTGAAPALMKVIARIARSFELALTEKVLAESVPIVGAVGGATINALFCDYFGQAARYHFGLLHLEKNHGREHVQAEFANARLIKKATRV
ncbi:EcsC family protein [Oligoflexus sp.]|uniref:EcsC family protein n=1 Tax=Oligoflexus sp. TaxID=1971216 RepID=UPI002D78AB82|nr:EcsC family protein [Oligoflexus sp.]